MRATEVRPGEEIGGDCVGGIRTELAEVGIRRCRAESWRGEGSLTVDAEDKPELEDE